MQEIASMKYKKRLREGAKCIVFVVMCDDRRVPTCFVECCFRVLLECGSGIRRRACQHELLKRCANQQAAVITTQIRPPFDFSIPHERYSYFYCDNLNYMTLGGMKRKMDTRAYIYKWDQKR